MKKITIGKTEDGIKLHRYLKNIFKSMPNSLQQKLIRKKYFEVNGKAADGNEILNANDVLTIYLGDDTFNKFYTRDVYSNDLNSNKQNNTKSENSYSKLINSIIYEDDNLIIFNKWAGLLSQSDKKDCESVNTLLNNYLDANKSVKDDEDILYKYRPSVVNRLDRNTEGLIIFAKTYLFAREVSKMIRDNRIDKYYKTIVNGNLKSDEGTLINLYKKDEKKNIAIIDDIENKELKQGFTTVKLEYKVLERNSDVSVLDIKLITGKSHQIRSQLSHIGHPIICDKKYMDISLYRDNVKKYKYKMQKLICYKITLGSFENEELKYLSYKSYELKVDFNI